ncbi:MAG: hypothetical protein WD972_01820 [Candidatus Andersenbacteria bacterium]
MPRQRKKTGEVPNQEAKEFAFVRRALGFSEYVATEPEGATLSDLVRKELRERIKQMLGSLSYNEREIMKLRYGLGDGYVYTLEEVAQIFKKTPPQILKVEAKIVQKLHQRPHISGETTLA